MDQRRNQNLFEGKMKKNIVNYIIYAIITAGTLFILAMIFVSVRSFLRF